MEFPKQSEAPMTVLVADDIEASRAPLADMVQSFGYRCLQAVNGRDALHCIDTLHPDMVLLDLLMPDIDGFEITRLVRQRSNGRWLPVIVTSSLEGDEHFIQALTMGAADYLVRPVRPAILQAKLQQYQRVLSLQADMALLAQRQLAIHEHIADAIITIDQYGVICEANLAAKKLLSANASVDLVGHSLEELCGVAPQAWLAKREIEYLPAGQPSIPLSVSASSWSIGAQSYCTIALHDLSEWRRIERMKDEFLATVSHELRTPLTSVLGALGLLAAGAAGALPPAAMELTAVAQRNGTRLSSLIDDVLDLTKLEGNRMVLQMRPADLNTLLLESVNANTAYAQRGGVSLQYECLVIGARALVDPDRFLQIMANLISNAIKHSSPGQTVQVVLTGERKGWQVAVADQGPGIDPAFRDKMFEKFSQADSSDRRAQGGTGLGLYISRMLVERMHGSISARSKNEGGAVFSLVFPQHDTGAESLWLMCIARDRQLLERLAEWLSPMVRVELVSDMVAAQSLLQRSGSPLGVIADPQAQGDADDFCAGLSRLADGNGIVLVGDSVDAHFASKQGMRWMSSAVSARDLLTAYVQSLIATATGGSQRG